MKTADFEIVKEAKRAVKRQLAWYFSMLEAKKKAEAEAEAKKS